MGIASLRVKAKRTESFQGIKEKRWLGENRQVSIRLRKNSLCLCVVWVSWGCLQLDERFVIEVMSGGWSSIDVPTLLGRKNLRCSAIALYGGSGQPFFFSMRRDTSFFLWTYGRPELLRNRDILDCNSKTLMWSEHLCPCYEFWEGAECTAKGLVMPPYKTLKWPYFNCWVKYRSHHIKKDIAKSKNRGRR